MGGNGKGSGLRQRQKTSGPFLKRPASFWKRPWSFKKRPSSFWRTASSFSGRARTSGPERKGYTTYVSGEFRTHPDDSHKTPATEFCKSAATATTQPSETTMDRAFQGVVAAPFFRWQKGLLPPLSPVFYPGTTGGGGKNRRRRRTKRREKETGTDRQKPETGPAVWSPLKDRTPAAARQGHSCTPTKPRLQPVNTRITIRRNFSSSPTEPKLQSWWNCSFNWTELKFQPEGTGWNSLSVCAFIL